MSDDLKNILTRVKKFIEDYLQLDEDLFCKNRNRGFTKGRQYFVAYAFNNLKKHFKRTKHDFGYQKIADFMNNRNHCTVIHALRKYEDLMYSDREYREESKGLFYLIDSALNFKASDEYTAKQIIIGSLELHSEVQISKMLSVLVDNDLIILSDIVNFLHSKKILTNE